MELSFFGLFWYILIIQCTYFQTISFGHCSRTTVNWMVCLFKSNSFRPLTRPCDKTRKRINQVAVKNMIWMEQLWQKTWDMNRRLPFPSPAIIIIIICINLSVQSNQSILNRRQIWYTMQMTSMLHFYLESPDRHSVLEAGGYLWPRNSTIYSFFHFISFSKK